RVVIGACVDLGAGALPYAPLVDALRTLVRDLGANAIRDLAGPALPTLARLVPFLGEARGVDSPDHHTRSLMFEGVLRLLDQLAPEAPVVLIFEDVHWADRSTLDLLAFLIGALTGERVLVVASYRTSDLHPRHPLASVLAEVDRARRAERFELRPFNRDELREFLAHLLGREPRPTEV